MDTPPTADALRAALEMEPRKAELHYLLGAELAQQRNYDDALSELSHALNLDPSLHSCRFQLGLLLLSMAQPDRARAVWAPLETLDESTALRHFKHGLDFLIENDFEACARALEAGIALNHSNPALNRDMLLIVRKARGALRNGVTPDSKDGDQTSAAVRRDLSLYDTDPD